MVKALGKNLRVTPRKACIVADLIRNKKVEHATQYLDFVNKKPAPIIKSILLSAVANAKRQNLYHPNMIVTIRVNKGIVMKRYKPISRGRTHGFLRRTSHIFIELR